MGGTSIACLNSRDRNLLGFRRDMLTAAAYGVEEFLFVHGDKPAVRWPNQRTDGQRHDRRSSSSGRRPGVHRHAGLPIGVTAGTRPLPAWKRDADFFFCQVNYSDDALLRWRESTESAARSTPA